MSKRDLSDMTNEDLRWHLAHTEEFLERLESGIVHPAANGVSKADMQKHRKTIMTEIDRRRKKTLTNEN